MLIRSFGRGVVATLMVTTSPALSAEPEIPEPFTIPADTPVDALPAAGWLESVFQSQVRQCNQSTTNLTLKKKNKSKPVSFVPVRIVNHLDLKKNETPPYPSVVSVRNGSPIAQEFLFVYQLKDGKHVISSAPHLPVVVSERDASTPVPSFSGAEYSVDCAQAVSAAAKIKSGYALPFASIEAALSGGTANSSAYTLDFSDGTFYSPLVAMWKGRTPDEPIPANAITAGKLFSTLTFWDWVTSNSSITGPKIMEQIRGINIFERTEASSESKINASSKAGLTLPFLEASGSTDASINRRERFTSKKVRVAAFTDDNNPATQTKYFDVPSLSDLQNTALSLSAFNLVATSPTGLSMYGTQQLPLTYRAVGMAPEFCNQQWTVADSNKTKGYLGFSSKSISRDAFGCDFVLNFLPTAQDVREGVALRPQFTLSKGEGVNQKKLTFSADEVRLTPAFKPRLVPTWQVDPVATQSSGAYTLQIEYQIDDDNQLVAETREHVKVSPVQISCAGQATVVTPTFDVLRRDLLGKVLRLGLSIPASATLDEVARKGERCSMGGDVEIEIRNSGGQHIWIPRIVPTTPLLFRAPSPPTPAA